ncbi:hypothetical protein [Vibrio phage 2 TSL-2019]|uniref:Uncharacterized protein n=1 Tax=Vibrio phage 2 TSL-2019 TaxID=2508172 RepID=A0A513PW76_9CAUD|nr:hypothetical protein HWC03_gp014 [Vibrio phage 2 TSL-2019]QAU04169.1 hypothetical protein [Vibrio phage 2 TSL-2019]
MEKHNYQEMALSLVEQTISEGKGEVLTHEGKVTLTLEGNDLLLIVNEIVHRYNGLRLLDRKGLAGSIERVLTLTLKEPDLEHEAQVLFDLERGTFWLDPIKRFVHNYLVNRKAA